MASICALLSPQAATLLRRDGAAALHQGVPTDAVRKGGGTLSRAAAFLRALVEGLFSALCATPRTSTSSPVPPVADHRNAWMNQFCEVYHSAYCVTGTAVDAEVGRTLIRAVHGALPAPLSLCPAAGAPPGLGEGAGAGAPDAAMAPVAAGAPAAPPASARGSRRRAREAPAAAGNGG